MKRIDVYDENLYGPAPLYNRPPGDSYPRTAYLEINPVAREISTGYNLEPDDRPPYKVTTGMLVWVELSPMASAEGIKELLHDPTVHRLAGRICDGHFHVLLDYYVEGKSVHKGMLYEDAKEAFKELQTLAGKIKLDRVMTAEEYLNNAKAESLWFEGETLERAADKLMEVAVEEEVIIDGDMVEALKHHVIAEYKRVGSLPRHILQGLRALGSIAEEDQRCSEQKQCSAADWVEGAPITDLWLPGETIEEAAAAIVSDAREHGVEIFGDMVAALWEWGREERIWGVYDLPCHILNGLLEEDNRRDVCC